VVQSAAEFSPIWTLLLESNDPRFVTITAWLALRHLQLCRGRPVARGGGSTITSYLRGLGAAGFRPDATPRNFEQAALAHDLVAFRNRSVPALLLWRFNSKGVRSTLREKPGQRLS
jgi:hypothetical protein